MKAKLGVMQPTTCSLVSLRAGAAPVVDVGFTTPHCHAGYMGTMYCRSEGPFRRVYGFRV